MTRVLLFTSSIALATVVVTGSAQAVRRGKAVPRKILGPKVWRLLRVAKASDVRVERIVRKADGQYGDRYGIAIAKSVTPTKSWWRKMKALLRSRRSYFVPRCNKRGVCPRLRCKTTPKAVLKLSRGKRSAVVVITICDAVQAGPTLAKLRPQVSLEPAEKRLEALLRQLFRPRKARCPPAGWRKVRHCVLTRVRAGSRKAVLAELKRGGYVAHAATHRRDIAISLNAKELKRLFGARYRFALQALSSRSGMGCKANVRGGRVPKRFRGRILSFAVGHQVCE